MILDSLKYSASYPTQYSVECTNPTNCIKKRERDNLYWEEGGKKLWRRREKKIFRKKISKNVNERKKIR